MKWIKLNWGQESCCKGAPISRRIFRSFSAAAEKGTSFKVMTPAARGGMASMFEALPEQAQQVVRWIENQLDVTVRWVSVGPHREQMISR